ncbi:uroporphyrinogen-III synthase [Acinetobacter sp. WZC-1]|uniref:uroporphyrinogen-III synthase n=1 Tax=Acinetobacter sp. WZC-1 TaxID=3459034 RepID=UPI00403DACCF
MLFINTRPADRAQPLTEHLTKAGFQVLTLPLLELRPCTYGEQLQQLYTELMTVQMIVVVSPTAVRLGMQYLQHSGIPLSRLSHVQWIAVGKATAGVLAEYGVQGQVPEVESSEGMLSLPVFSSDPALNKVAFWRGLGGRQFMMQQCLERHISVLNFILYERALPLRAMTQFAVLKEMAVQNRQSFWMCISSEAGWTNWRQLCEHDHDILQQGHYLVLGERLYQLLQQDKKNSGFCFNISKILSLEPQSVSQVIACLQGKQ